MDNKHICNSEFAKKHGFFYFCIQFSLVGLIGLVGPTKKEENGNNQFQRPKFNSQSVSG